MSPFRPRSLASSLLRTGPMFFSLFILSPVHFLCFSGYLYPIFTSFLHSKKDRISAILYATPGFAPGSNGIPSYASFAVFIIPRP